MITVFLVPAVLITLVKAQCDYSQYMVPGGQSYRITSNGAYNRGTSCTWRAFTNTGAKIQLFCSSIDIPVSGQTCLDKLYVSNTQNPNNGIIYCGRQQISHLSESNQLLVQIVVSNSSPGGSFTCDIKAINGSGGSGNNPTCSCGYSYRSRIVGGTETGINEFPMMAGIVSNSAKGLICGATIITQTYSLTAAHCLKGKTISDLAVLVGDHDISTGTETNASMAIRASRLFVHPNYDETTEINDIGIVQIATPLKFTSRVGPACLPFTHPETHVNEVVQMLGWGTTSFGGRTATKLQKITMRVIPITDCQTVYGSRVYPFGQTCVYSQNKDSCQYDSGGPVLWLDPRTNRYMLIATISYGRGCGMNYPSVNTRVNSYLPWIENIIQSDQYCVV